jgi:hypothetical protein
MARRDPPSATRDETPQERADRNWVELLQELRVSQTGVQLLAGFLATLPFQARFEELDSFQRGWYVGVLALAIVIVGITTAPVAIHRRVFQRNAKPELVQTVHRLTQAALALISLMLSAIVFLVVDVVYNRTAATWAMVAVLLVLAGLLVALPTYVRHRLA